MTEKEKQAREEDKELEDKLKELLIMYTLLHRHVKFIIKDLYSDAGKWSWDNLNKYNRLQKSLDIINNNINDLKKSELLFIRTTLADRYSKTAKRTMEIMGLSYKVDKKIITELLKEPWSGLHFSERIWKNAEALKLKLKEIINVTAINEQGISSAISKIQKEFAVSYANAKRLVKTEYARVQYLADVEAYKKAKVKKVQYNSVLDANTCEDCSSLDGRIYELGKQPSLPRHPNCKCFYEPVKSNNG